MFNKRLGINPLEKWQIVRGSASRVPFLHSPRKACDVSLVSSFEFIKLSVGGSVILETETSFFSVPVFNLGWELILSAHSSCH